MLSYPVQSQNISAVWAQEWAQFEFKSKPELESMKTKLKKTVDHCIPLTPEQLCLMLSTGNKNKMKKARKHF